MRHFLLRLAAAVLLLAGLGRADSAFLFPAGTYADSAAVNAALPCAAFSDSLSSTVLSMTGKVLRLDVTWGKVPKGRARAGIRLPFNDRWAPVDFSCASAVTFKYKTSVAATKVQFTPNSDKYPGALAGVQMCVTLNGSTSGKTANVALPTGIGYLDWMVQDHPEDVHLTWDDVMGGITDLEFGMMPVLDSTGNVVTSRDFRLEISDVRIEEMLDCGGGWGNIWWSPAQGTGCTGAWSGLGTDGRVSGTAGSGVRWSSHVDTMGQGKWKGISVLEDADGDGSPVEREEAGAMLGIRARLRKGGATEHPYAGWAGIGARFLSDAGQDRVVDMTGLTGISFRLRTAAEFDAENLTGVLLRIRSPQVGDSVAFTTGIRAEASTDSTVCIDANQLRQPSWYRERRPFDPGAVAGLDWELKINKDATDTASTSGFWIGDVKLWGTYAASGLSRSRSAAGPSLAAAYAGALRLSYALDGATSARVEVLRLDGSRVASFEAPGSVSGRAFPLELGAGTYLATVRGAGRTATARFAVAR